MLIQQGTREDAIHALMNTWIKIPTRWCLGCMQDFDGTFPCCDDPYLTTNALVFKRHIKDLKLARDNQKNKFGSTDNKSMRRLLKFPPSLYEFLDMSMRKLYDEHLFTKEYDQIWFAKKFNKYFSVAEVI